jgi:DNA-binding transcriptional regulator LsrR (DeoR family)
VRAIRAVLRGGYATTLITDSVAAKGLLNDD